MLYIPTRLNFKPKNSITAKARTKTAMDPIPNTKVSPLYERHDTCLPGDALKRSAFKTSLTHHQRAKIENYISKKTARHAAKVLHIKAEDKAEIALLMKTWKAGEAERDAELTSLRKIMGRYIETLEDLYQHKYKWAVKTYEDCDSEGNSYGLIVRKLRCIYDI